MPKRVDLTGNVYEELTVIEMLYSNITLLHLPYTYSEEDIVKEILNILSPVEITA